MGLRYSEENLCNACFNADKNECHTEGQRDVDNQTLQNFFPAVGLALVLLYMTLGTSSSAEKEFLWFYGACIDVLFARLRRSAECLCREGGKQFCLRM